MDKKEKRSLKCILTEDELKAAGADLARAVQEREQAENDLKSVKKQFDSKIASAEAVISLAAAKIQNGYEYRPVEVTIHYDYEAGGVFTYREDTGETIEERPMRADELQQRIEFGGGNSCASTQ